MSDVRLDPVSRPFVLTFTPPGSKSLTNRALVLAALAEGQCELSNVLLADDTRVMLEGLRALGFEISLDEQQHIVRVTGRGGKIERDHAEIFCGNSGTTIRFLTALCALGKGTFTLDGNQRMRQRPIGALTGMLRNLGVRSEHSTHERNAAEGFPPVRVLADGLPGGIVRYGSEVSSQFLSAVLMIAPYARNEVTVLLDGRQTSWPYVAMTMQLMDAFGVTPELIRDPQTHEPRRIIIPPGQYAPTNYAIEPDASNASYFLALAALHEDSTLTINGLGKSSLQGDVGFAQVLGRMGADVAIMKDSMTITGPQKLKGIDIDLSDMPDVAQTLAVVALFADGRTKIRGLHTLRVKETDRLAALQTELQKLGASAQIEEDALIIDPPEEPRRAEINTYDDHRMAMSFALAGTKVHGIIIKDAQCVNKTYPGYFQDLKSVLASRT